jgi:mannose-6-phosphate isomerase-like protein (cupin superfamily)
MKSMVINLKEKLSLFNEHWSPKIIGELNNQHVKIAKLKGEFVRHQHEQEDELFFVIEGTLQIEFDHETVTLKPGELIIVPKGVYHKPIAKEEVKVMLFEPKSTLNTGNTQNEFTHDQLDHI